MVKLMHLKNDWKQISREPMMMILFLCPLLIAIVFRLLAEFLLPFVFEHFQLSFSPYKPYALTLALTFCPLMLGVVMGFLMMDDKDAKIIELMSVTPLTRRGYIQNRMAFTGFATIVHTSLCYVIMGQYIFGILSFIAMLFILCMLAAAVGLVFFSIADDKVKGLTYAKGLNLIVVFAFADLLKGNFIKVSASLFPTYWIAEIVQQPDQTGGFLAAAASGVAWLLLIALVGRWKWANE